MKKILVLPVKNEEWILEKSLACASLWADHIIVADQQSTDRTLEICKRFPKVTVIENKTEFHSSNVRKLLLDAARNFEGQNAIFSFDADEIPTDHMLSAEFNNQLLSCQPGTGIELQWVNLWRSPQQYRNDDSVWSNAWKFFGFIDDRKLAYTSLNVVNDHTSRIPIAAMEKAKRFEFPKILHYQFVDWSRVISKQAYYRMVESIQRPQTFLETVKINARYYPSKDETGVRLSGVPPEWTNSYTAEGVELVQFTRQELTWFDVVVLRKFAEQKTKKFSHLDIWDISWEQKRQQAIKLGVAGIPDYPIVDPRTFIEKLYHQSQPAIYRAIKLLKYKR